jgi:hypothetical protein
LRAPSRLNVRFGSKADICAATSHVRFVPNSDRESGHPGRYHATALTGDASFAEKSRDHRVLIGARHLAEPTPDLSDKLFRNCSALSVPPL